MNEEKLLKDIRGILNYYHEIYPNEHFNIQGCQDRLIRYINDLMSSEIPYKNNKVKSYEPHFNGSDYVPEFDFNRLKGQLKRVYSLMVDGSWRTLDEISSITGDPPASISAQLRHLRKARFGNHIVNKRPRGDRNKGLFEYQLLENPDES